MDRAERIRRLMPAGQFTSREQLVKWCADVISAEMDLLELRMRAEMEKRFRDMLDNDN